jgi:hypothetical protein
MGSCSSKIIPVVSLPLKTDTSSREVSYDYTDVVGHIYNRDKLAKVLKSEFDLYKNYVRAIEKMIEIELKFYMSTFFYDRQEKITIRIKKLMDEISRYDTYYVKILRGKFDEFEKSYRGYILHLYMTDRLTLSDELQSRNDVRTFFGTRQSIVSFLTKTTTINYTPEQSEEEA